MPLLAEYPLRVAGGSGVIGLNLVQYVAAPVVVTFTVAAVRCPVTVAAASRTRAIAPAKPESAVRELLDITPPQA